jgi:hypothetical protein
VEHLELGAKKNWCGATLVVSGDWHPFGPSQQRKMVGSSSTTCSPATEGGPMAGTGPEPLEVSSTRSVGAGRGGGGSGWHCSWAGLVRREGGLSPRKNLQFSFFSS